MMPEVIIVNDDASFISSSAASFVAQRSFQVPPSQLRRQKTVKQLRRWVSKRMSRNSNDAEARKGNGPSNKCLDEGPETKSDSIDTSLRMSYVAFCNRFTLSGLPETPRAFSLTGNMEEEQDMQEQMITTPLDLSSTVQNSIATSSISDPRKTHSLDQNRAPTTDQPFIPYTDISPSSAPASGSRESLDKKTFDRSFQHAPIHCLQPPPQVMTPLTYRETQRLAREGERRQKPLDLLRSFVRNHKVRRVGFPPGD